MNLKYRCLYLLLVVYSVSLLAADVRAQCTPPPLEEGQSGNLVCKAPLTATNITWQLQRNGRFINVSTCSIRGGCTDLFPDSYSATNRNTSSTEHESLFTIHNASRSESTFKCLVDGGYGEIECKVPIYVKPETPTCSQPVAVSSNEIALTCNTSRVYPKALCLFKYLSQTVTTPVSGVLSYLHPQSPSSAEDFATICTFRINVQGFLPGSIQFVLDIFPQLVSIPQKAVVTLNTVPNIELRATTSPTTTDCPKGPSINGSYIDARFASKTTCSCQLEDVGFPPGRAQWYNKTGSVIGVTKPGESSSTVTLNYNFQDSNPAYECRAETALNTTSSQITYQPTFAYGPTVVFMNMTDTSFDLCPSDNKNLTITCTVPIVQVNPEPVFSIQVDSQVLVQKQPGRVGSSEYIYKYSYRPSSGGNRTVTCRAENSMFEVETSKTVSLTVREPPSSDPEMTVWYKEMDLTQRTATVEAGDTLTVTCLVEGGVPQVERVTLNCGDKRAVGQGNEARLELMATQNLNGLICTCRADHVTKCYNQSKSVLLNVSVTPKKEDDGSNIPVIAGLCGGLGGAIVLISVAVVLIVRLYRRRKRAPSQPPSYVTEWVNNKPDDIMSSHTWSLPGNKRYVNPPAYTLPQPPRDNIYDQIETEPDYILPADTKRSAPLPHSSGVQLRLLTHPPTDPVSVMSASTLSNI